MGEIVGGALKMVQIFIWAGGLKIEVAVWFIVFVNPVYTWTLSIYMIQLEICNLRSL